MMIGLIILLIIIYFWSSSNSGAPYCTDHQSSSNTPLEILNERYARGEIQREDYLERKQVLTVQKQLISIKKG